MCANTMKNDLTYSSREKILKKIYQFAPFPIEGDLPKTTITYQSGMISCLICSARASSVLALLLNDLAEQSLDRDHFEILICDNSLASHDALIKQYASRLSIQHLRDVSTLALIGNMKNKLLQSSRGALILFLDDDTRLPQKDFLTQALHLSETNPADIILPQGTGLAPQALGDYHFLDPYSFANRCCLYRRALLDTLKAFHEDITAYEDIDLGIRAIMNAAKVLRTDQLHYQHPALFFTSLKKPLAIGQSIIKLRTHYPLYIWLIIYVNALSFLLLALFPTMKNRQWFKISLGVLLAPLTRERHSYRDSSHTHITPS